MYDKLLVLDLDETLVHSCDECDHPRWAKKRDYFACGYVGYHRPHLTTFLRWARGSFRHLGIWTASTADYAHEVIRTFVPLNFFDFIWDRKRCTPQGYDQDYLKPIKKLQRRGYDQRTILAIDDKAGPWARSYGNLLQVPAFGGDPEDRWLLEAMEYLPQFCDAEDIRPFDFRRWAPRQSRNGC